MVSTIRKVKFGPTQKERKERGLPAPKVAGRRTGFRRYSFRGREVSKEEFIRLKSGVIKERLLKQVQQSKDRNELQRLSEKHSMSFPSLAVAKQFEEEQKTKLQTKDVRVPVRAGGRGPLMTPLPKKDKVVRTKEEESLKQSGIAFQKRQQARFKREQKIDTAASKIYSFTPVGFLAGRVSKRVSPESRTGKALGFITKGHKAIIRTPATFTFSTGQEIGTTIEKQVLAVRTEKLGGKDKARVFKETERALKATPKEFGKTVISPEFLFTAPLIVVGGGRGRAAGRPTGKAARGRAAATRAAAKTKDVRIIAKESIKAIHELPGGKTQTRTGGEGAIGLRGRFDTSKIGELVFKTKPKKGPTKFKTETAFKLKAKRGVEVIGTTITEGAKSKTFAKFIKGGKEIGRIRTKDISRAELETGASLLKPRESLGVKFEKGPFEARKILKRTKDKVDVTGFAKEKPSTVFTDFGAFKTTITKKVSKVPKAAEAGKVLFQRFIKPEAPTIKVPSKLRTRKPSRVELVFPQERISLTKPILKKPVKAKPVDTGVSATSQELGLLQLPKRKTKGVTATTFIHEESPAFSGVDFSKVVGEQARIGIQAKADVPLITTFVAPIQPQSLQTKTLERQFNFTEPIKKKQEQLEFIRQELIGRPVGKIRPAGKITTPFQPVGILLKSKQRVTEVPIIAFDEGTISKPRPRRTTPTQPASVTSFLFPKKPRATFKFPPFKVGLPKPLLPKGRSKGPDFGLQQFKYTPGFVETVFRVRGKKPKQKLFTGFELRPLRLLR